MPGRARCTHEIRYAGKDWLVSKPAKAMQLKTFRTSVSSSSAEESVKAETSSHIRCTENPRRISADSLRQVAFILASLQPG